MAKALHCIFRKPTETDIKTLTAQLRQEDIDDLKAVGWHSMEFAVRLSVLRSDWQHLQAVEVNKELVCIFGCVPPQQHFDAAIPWLLCTNAMGRYGREVTVRTRFELNRMLDTWPALSNVAAASSKKTLRWLELCGFEMQESVIYPATGVEVVPFKMIKRPDADLH
jgi:hypothetical protein